jgi:phage shock protein A
VTSLSTAEFNERVTILRRFKQALARQRDRFRAYLDRLEQRSAADDPKDDLEFYVELERSVVHEIARFERTIEPLETLYRAHDPDGSSEIPVLRDALYRTRDEVLRRTRENEQTLRDQVDALRGEIAALRQGRSSRRGPAVPAPSAATQTAAYVRPTRTVLVDVTA